MYFIFFLQHGWLKFKLSLIFFQEILFRNVYILSHFSKFPNSLLQFIEIHGLYNKKLFQGHFNMLFIPYSIIFFIYLSNVRYRWKYTSLLPLKLKKEKKTGSSRFFLYRKKCKILKCSPKIFHNQC